MWRDESLILDIVHSANRIIDYTIGLGVETFEHDEQLQDSVIRRIGIIGEAARLLSEETKASIPDIEWSEIIGMRNVLIHDYRHIRMSRVWDVVQHDIPKLIEKLEPLIRKPPKP